MNLKCIGFDPYCPCQDGDACNYRSYPGSPGMPLPKFARHVRDAAADCARVLVEDYPDRLTPEQYIRAFIATMRPESADLECIALAVRVIEVRK